MNLTLRVALVHVDAAESYIDLVAVQAPVLVVDAIRKSGAAGTFVALRAARLAFGVGAALCSCKFISQPVHAVAVAVGRASAGIEGLAPVLAVPRAEVAASARALVATDLFIEHEGEGALA